MRITYPRKSIILLNILQYNYGWIARSVALVQEIFYNYRLELQGVGNLFTYGGHIFFQLYRASRSALAYALGMYCDSHIYTSALERLYLTQHVINKYKCFFYHKKWKIFISLAQSPTRFWTLKIRFSKNRFLTHLYA